MQHTVPVNQDPGTFYQAHGMNKKHVLDKDLIF